MKGSAAPAACLAALLLLGACHSGGGVREELDARTGITWTADRSPVVFARTEGRYSRSARDYVYLGPVEVNRQGTRDYYLWVGVATTLDRGYLAPALAVPETLYVDVRGEVIELPLQPWSSLAPIAEESPPYATSVDLQTELAARVSTNLLQLLAANLPSAIRVAIPGSPTREYVRWEHGIAWQGFVAQMESSTTMATPGDRVD